MPRSTLRTLGLLVLLVSLAVGLQAQTSGTIRGQVVDGGGAALPGVTVTATSDSRGTSRVAVTGNTGTFALSTMPVDTYTVEATLEGYHPRSVRDVRVRISETVTLEFEMALDTIEESIIVSAAPILDTSDSAVGASYTAEFIEELPTARNFWDMMGVAPGVTPQDEQSIALSAFGSGITSNSWNIDGLNTTNAETGEAFWWISPDIIEEVQVLAIGAPARFGNMSGAALNVVTKSGTNNFKGTLNLYHQGDGLTDDNAEINGIGFSRDKFEEYTFSLGGPIKQDKLWYFVAHQNYRRAYTEAGENPEFPADDKSENYDLKINAQLTDSTSLEGKFHYEDWDFDSADPFSTPDASGSNYGHNPAYGLRLNSVLNSRNLLEVAYSGYSATQFWMSKTGSTADPFWDTAPADGGPWLYSGNISYPYIWDIERDQVNAHISTHAADFLNGDHEFTFGVEYGSGLGDSITAGGLNGAYFYRSEYSYEYYGYTYTIPYYYRASSRAYHYGGETDTLSAFIDDSWKVNEKLTLNLGLRYDKIGSDIPDYPELDMRWNETGNILPGIKSAVEWEHFSPRLGFAYTIGDSSVLRGFYGKFYDGNVMGNWYTPPPTPPVWEYHYASSLDGPWTHYFTWEWGDFPFDPDLKPPETDQYTMGWERQIGDDYALGIQGIYKEGKNLIGWEILDDGVYEQVPWTNPFTGETINLVSIIQQPTTRKGNRPGPGSLAPPGAAFSHDYKGAFITLNKRHTDGWGMQASYTWSDSNGLAPKPTSTVQGDPLWNGTDGRDPNNWINAEQALQSEREHVIQMQGSFDLPASFTGSVIYRFLSGKPYNRQLSVGQSWSSSPLAQGTQTVIAIPADSSTAMPDQNIIDLGLAKELDLGPTALQINVHLYNALNEDAHDWWQTLNVPPGDVYVPSGYIWPRRAMLHLRLTF